MPTPKYVMKGCHPGEDTIDNFRSTGKHVIDIIGNQRPVAGLGIYRILLV